ncbi:hypothetical protein FRC01_006402, partial [Tulasnella sp. 417]
MPHVGKRWIRKCLKWLPTSRSNRRAYASSQPKTTDSPKENEKELGNEKGKELEKQKGKEPEKQKGKEPEKQKEKEFADHDVPSLQPKAGATPSILRLPSELV